MIIYTKNKGIKVHFATFTVKTAITAFKRMFLRAKHYFKKCTVKIKVVFLINY